MGRNKGRQHMNFIKNFNASEILDYVLTLEQQCKDCTGPVKKLNILKNKINEVIKILPEKIPKDNALEKLLIRLKACLLLLDHVSANKNVDSDSEAYTKVDQIGKQILHHFKKIRLHPPREQSEIDSYENLIMKLINDLNNIDIQDEDDKALDFRESQLFLCTDILGKLKSQPQQSFTENSSRNSPEPVLETCNDSATDDVVKTTEPEEKENSYDMKQIKDAVYIVILEILAVMFQDKDTGNTDSESNVATSFATTDQDDPEPSTNIQKSTTQCDAVLDTSCVPFTDKNETEVGQDGLPITVPPVDSEKESNDQKIEEILESIQEITKDINELKQRASNMSTINEKLDVLHANSINKEDQLQALLELSQKLVSQMQTSMNNIVPKSHSVLKHRSVHYGQARDNTNYDFLYVPLAKDKNRKSTHNSTSTSQSEDLLQTHVEATTTKNCSIV